MAEATDEQVECGFCITRLEDLEDVRILSCNHLHCLRCLLENFEVNQIVRCPLCRYHPPLRYSQFEFCLLIIVSYAILCVIFSTE